MKLGVMCMAGALAFAPVIAGAQGVPARGMKIVTVTAAAIDKALPVLQADSATGNGPGEDRFAAIGMNKQEYVALKNALMIAKLDDANPSRLELPFDDGSLAARRSNAKLYHARAARLGPVLERASIDSSCTICKPKDPNVRGRTPGLAE